MTATYEKIATNTVSGSSTTAVTFSSIPSTYTDLVMVFNGGEAVNAGITIRFNSDTGTNYSQTRIYGNGTSAASARRTSTATVYLDDGVAFNTDAGSSNGIMQIQNYSNTTTYKTWLQRAGWAGNGTMAGVGLWRSTSAISTLSFHMSSSYIVAGSTFTIYGIKAE